MAQKQIISIPFKNQINILQTSSFYYMDLTRRNAELYSSSAISIILSRSSTTCIWLFCVQTYDFYLPNSPTSRFISSCSSTNYISRKESTGLWNQPLIFDRGVGTRVARGGGNCLPNFDEKSPILLLNRVFPLKLLLFAPLPLHFWSCLLPLIRRF